MDNHVWDLHLKRFRFCFAEGLQFCPLAGAGGCLLKLRVMLLTGLGSMAWALEDFAPFKASFLTLGEQEYPCPFKGRFQLSM